jgi:hypothetical protein
MGYIGQTPTKVPLTSADITDGTIALADMASQSVDEDNLHISNSGSNGNFLSKQSGDAGGLTWAAAGGGKIVQVVNTSTGAFASGTTITVSDDTIPQKTEGDEYFTLAITPTNSSNKLIITVLAQMSSSASTNLTYALFQDTTANALSSAFLKHAAGYVIQPHNLIHYMTAGTTSSTTFKFRAGGQGGTNYLNGDGSREHGGVMESSMTIMEIEV